MQQNLQLNIIPFKPIQNEIEVAFYTEYKEDYCPLYIESDLQGLLDDKLTETQKKVSSWLYTNFQQPKEGAIVISVNLYTHTNFAIHYFRHLVYNYFRNGVAHIIQRNYIEDIEVWFFNPNEVREGYNIFDKFTLNVNYCGVTSSFELVVSL